MSLFVLSLVLFSALMHAGWNLYLKQSGDRLVTISTMHLVSGMIGMVAVLFLPLPHVESWPYIFASVVLHLGYHLFLVKAYVYGDLGQVYPIARGTSPLLLGFVSVFWIGEELTFQSIIDRKSTRLNSSHVVISYAVFCLKKKNTRLPSIHHPTSSSCYPSS